MTSTRPILVFDLNDTLSCELTSARIGAGAAAAAAARSYRSESCDIIHIGDNAANEFIGLRLLGYGTIGVLTGRPAGRAGPRRRDHPAGPGSADARALSSLHRAWWRPTQRSRRHDD